jgi:hypothetical protein
MAVLESVLVRWAGSSLTVLARRRRRAGAISSGVALVLLLSVLLLGCSQATVGILTGKISLAGRVPSAALIARDQVVVSQGRKAVARQPYAKEKLYRFSLAPGRYAITLAGPVTATPFGNVAVVHIGATTRKDLAVVFHGSAPSAGPILGTDGLGVVAVGDTQSAAVSTVTGYLGSPTATTPGDCRGTTEVQWNDLSVEFTSGRLSGYRYLRGGLAAVGTVQRPPGPGTPLLKTATGATLGMTLTQVRSLYPADDFSEEQGGAIVVRETTTGDRLFLGFFEDSPSTLLTEIKGGGPCGDF